MINPKLIEKIDSKEIDNQFIDKIKEDFFITTDFSILYSLGNGLRFIDDCYFIVNKNLYSSVSKIKIYNIYSSTELIIENEIKETHNELESNLIVFSESESEYGFAFHRHTGKIY